MKQAAQHAHRNTLIVEDAEVVEHQAYEGDQFILLVHSPKIALRAKAGQFAHISCAPQIPMRRPLSIMRSGGKEGWLSFLYKVVGNGTRLLSQHKVGDCISLIGPIGNRFSLDARRNRPLLLGGGVGIPPMVFLADTIQKQSIDYHPFVIMGSEVPFPFDARASKFLMPGLPDSASHGMPLLEDWNIPNRLSSLQGYTGCYTGYVTDLARIWLNTLNDKQRQEVAVYACGPHPMLQAVAQLAAEFELPCQVSLEEYMACAVGGCAGCVVPVKGAHGIAMKRVCVDGPVFDAAQVF